MRALTGGGGTDQGGGGALTTAGMQPDGQRQCLQDAKGLLFSHPHLGLLHPFPENRPLQAVPL